MGGGIIIPGDYDDWKFLALAKSGAGAPQRNSINGAGCRVWSLANGDGVEADGNQVPHDYAEGTDITPHLHWSVTVTGVYTGTWTMRYVDRLSVATGSALLAEKTITIPISGTYTANEMQTANFSAVIAGVVATVPRRISSIIHADLILSLSAAAGRCQLEGWDCHYIKDRLGSSQITTK